jgi:hypothetical protein
MQKGGAFQPGIAMLDQTNFPCGRLPTTHEQMGRAEPCPRCHGRDLVPVSDCQTPPELAIACEDCGEIEGDASTLAEAVANWNNIRNPT